MVKFKLCINEYTEHKAKAVPAGMPTHKTLQINYLTFVPISHSSKYEKFFSQNEKSANPCHIFRPKGLENSNKFLSLF